MSGTRPSTYAEKRSSGVAGFGDRGAGGPASSRPRMSDGNGSFRADGSKASEAPKISSRYAETTHKRSTSGHPIPRSTSTSFEERRTEKVQVTTRETFTTRTRSPQRRSATTDKGRAADGPKQRAPEPRPREARQETPVPGAPSPSGHREATMLI
jgi:gamma-tubulin complex component 2